MRRMIGTAAWVSVVVCIVDFESSGWGQGSGYPVRVVDHCRRG